MPTITATTIEQTSDTAATNEPATLDELQQRHAEMVRANGELHAAREAAEAAVAARIDEARQDAMEEYKTRVKEVAQRYARQHNLCSVVDDALGELSIETVKEVSFEAVVRVRISAETGSTSISDLEDFIRSPLTVRVTPYSQETVTVSLDSDWEGVSINSVTLDSVEDVEGD